MSSINPRVDLQVLVDHYQHPCFVLDARRRVLLVNHSFTEQLRVDHEPVVGRSIESLLEADIELRSVRDRVNRHPPFAGLVDLATRERYMRLCRDRFGTRLKLQVSTYPLRAASEEIYIGDLALAEPVATCEAPSGEHLPVDCEMVGASAAFRRVRTQLLNIAATDAPVLLQGKTGTGKELAAAFIHAHSTRRAGPLVTVDCTTLCGDLVESELYGHERGAFTGSLGRKPGLFELADGGSLFLDEIGEMPIDLQAKLLRALESGEYRSVGGTKTYRANTRIICATNRDLRKDTSFRRDLYYRIACLTVKMPTLAERTEDIPLLARVLLEPISQSVGRELNIDHAAVELLKRHRYAGNIRELRNTLWASAAHALDGIITAQTVAEILQPQEIETDPNLHSAQFGIGSVSRRDDDADLSSADLTLADLEAEHLARLIAKHKGKRSEIAKELGVSERTVYRKLKRHNLSRMESCSDAHAVVDCVG